MDKIYLKNTLSKQKEEFKPIKKNRVGLYTCGPTVYDYPHIGNMRSYIMNDLLKRMFIFNGYKVKHIMNITDVGHLTSDADSGEDKLEKAKLRENKSAWDIAKYYTDIFIDYSNRLNILPPTKYIPATSCIKEQIKLVKILDNKGYIYKTKDGMYFDTSKFADYGKLTGQNLADLKAGARIEMSKDKINPTDFAVWKFSPKDKRRDMEWPSPWGVGFPGWHLECSTISTKYLKQPFDVHTGGIEHIPIHHTNEIAQSEAANNKPMANYWIHFEHLLLKDAKMSKSKGETITIDSLLERSINPLALRYLTLQTHYSKHLEFSWEALNSAQIAFNKLNNRLASITTKGKINKDYLDKFTQAIDNDLNISQGLAIVWDLMKDDKIIDGDKKTTILELDKVLGLNLKSAKKIEIPTEIINIANERLQAKQNKEWDKADELRKDIENKGYIINDNNDSYEIIKNE